MKTTEYQGKCRAYPLLLLGLWALVTGCTVAADRPAPEEMGVREGTMVDDELPELTTCKDLLRWTSTNKDHFTTGTKQQDWELTVESRTAACQACMLAGSERTLTDVVAKDSTDGIGVTRQYILRLYPKNETLTKAPELAQTSISLIGRDTIPCAFVHHEPGIEGVPFYTYVLGFEASETVAVHAMHIDHLFTGVPWMVHLEETGLRATHRLLQRAIAPRRS